jgi:hypothetical protein
MEYNSKTQFKTGNGSTTVAAIANANTKTERAAFDLALKLGIFGIWCKEKNLAVKTEFQKMATAAKIDPAKIASLQVQVSHGMRLVKAESTFEDLQNYSELVEVRKDKNQKEYAKLTSPEGLQLKGGIEGFSAYAAQSLDGKKPKLVKASSGKVLDKAKAVDAAENAAIAKGPAPIPTNATTTKGKGAELVSIVAPLVMTKTAKANFREAIEAHCIAADIALESVFPELAKVNA